MSNFDGREIMKQKRRNKFKFVYLLIRFEKENFNPKMTKKPKKLKNRLQNSKSQSFTRHFMGRLVDSKLALLVLLVCIGSFLMNRRDERFPNEKRLIDYYTQNGCILRKL